MPKQSFLTAGWRWATSLLPATKRDVAEMEKRIQMTQAELAAQLAALKVQADKIATEQGTRSDALAAEINRLTDLIGQGGEVSEEVTTQLAAVQAAFQALDDSIPDAPAPPTPA